MNRQPEDLCAFQLAAFWSDYLAVRKHVERESEHLVLVGPFAQRRAPRHASAERFTAWRARSRAAQLAKVYERCSLLGGFRHE
jgi:hypothetical protein